MADKPLIFSAPMIRALLDGRKSMTRRVLKPQPEPWAEAVEFAPYKGYGRAGELIQRTRDDYRQHGLGKAPYAVGGRLWVKETHWRLGEWSQESDEDGTLHWTFCPSVGYGPVFYAPPDALSERAMGGRGWWKRPSIFHEREFSRLILLVTGVKVERLQEISDLDAQAEGIYERHAIGDDPTHNVWTWQREGWRYDTPRAAFQALWESINGTEAWRANPWVAAITFKTVKANIDHLPAEAA